MKRDDIFKKLFLDKEIFAMLLKDFIKESWTNEIDESKLTLVHSLYPDGLESNRESDVIYKYQYKNENIFVFVLLEHQSNVNYLMTFRVLEYMVKLWRSYIDDAGEKSSNKSFLLPPIYPIIFYDGINNWTAVKNFEDKVEDKEKFYKYIPKFEYDIIDLNSITFKELESYEDLLSAILLIDKIKKPEDLKELGELGLDYWGKIEKNVKGRRALEKIAEAINLLLIKINTPEEAREKIVEDVFKGRLKKMFEVVEGWDIQATLNRGLKEGIEQGIEQGMYREKLEVAKKLLRSGVDIEIIKISTGLSLTKIEELRVNH